MKNYKSINNGFSDCPFSIILPKIIVVDSYINFSFSVNFSGKPKQTKYIAKSCTITDQAGNSAFCEFEGQSNFLGSVKNSISIEANKLNKNAFSVAVNIITLDGESVDITYSYFKSKPLALKSVAIADMTTAEKDYFTSFISSISAKSTVNNAPETKQKIDVNDQNVLNKYIDAISSELWFLKNNGGKKHKVTDGRLLTPNSNELCYSFELESELYLSDDAPVSVILGLDTVYGTVIMCDGFQIIVSLERSIGDIVSSAQISVEPWKLLEKLRDTVKAITPNDAIAWKLFCQGPSLAAKESDINDIQFGQDAAIRHALDEDITVVWGPPGTGKTYTMAQMTERFVSKGKTVLIVSHSNISVDNVVKQISKQFSNNHLKSIIVDGKALRYGYVRDEELRQNDNCVAFSFALKKHPELKKQYDSFSDESKKLKIEYQFRKDAAKAVRIKDLEKLLKNIRAKLKIESQALTAKAQVVATTVSKIYMDKLFENRKYDVVMFDEVSMAYVPQLLCASTFAKERFICVGDFRQLSPIVQSEKSKEVLQHDIFSFLNICRYGEIHNHPWLVMLNEQRRMHPHISEFSARYIYKGLLKDHSSVYTKWDSVVSCKPLENTAMALIDLNGMFCAASKNADNSRFNILGAFFSFATALNAEKSQEKLPFKNEEKVGIITPYAAQTRLIRAIIQDYRESKENTAISCATVHQFQGSERNVVIFDAVESYPFTKPGWLVSKNDNGSVMRLINVALTRARCKFLTFADSRFWNDKFHDTQNTYFKLLGHIKTKESNVHIKANQLIDFIKTLDFGKNIKPFFSSDDAFEFLLNDIRNSKKKVFVSLPTTIMNSQYERVILDELKARARAGVMVTGKFKGDINLVDTWKNLLFESKDATFPLIVIDDKIIWYGFPLSILFFTDKKFNKFNTPLSPILRITGKHTNEMISSLCDLDYRIDEKGFKIKLVEKSNTSVGKGLIEFIKNTEACTKCGAPMNLTKSHNGKTILKCSSCGTIDLLSVHTVNRFLNETNGKCSVCGKDIYAALGPFGLYVRCGDGHFTKLSEL